MKELNLFTRLIKSYKKRISNYGIRTATIRRAANFNRINELRGNTIFSPFQAQEKQSYDDLIKCLQKLVAGESLDDMDEVKI